MRGAGTRAGSRRRGSSCAPRARRGRGRRGRGARRALGRLASCAHASGDALRDFFEWKGDELGAGSRRSSSVSSPRASHVTRTSTPSRRHPTRKAFRIRSGSPARRASSGSRTGSGNAASARMRRPCDRATTARCVSTPFTFEENPPVARARARTSRAPLAHGREQRLSRARTRTRAPARATRRRARALRRRGPAPPRPIPRRTLRRRRSSRISRRARERLARRPGAGSAGRDPRKTARRESASRGRAPREPRRRARPRPVMRGSGSGRRDARAEARPRWPVSENHESTNALRASGCTSIARSYAAPLRSRLIAA